MASRAASCSRTGVLLIYLAGEFDDLHGLYTERRRAGRSRRRRRVRRHRPARPGSPARRSSHNVPARWARSGRCSRPGTCRCINLSVGARDRAPASCCCSPPSCARPSCCAGSDRRRGHRLVGAGDERPRPTASRPGCSSSACTASCTSRNLVHLMISPRGRPGLDLRPARRHRLPGGRGRPRVRRRAAQHRRRRPGRPGAVPHRRRRRRDRHRRCCSRVAVQIHKRTGTLDPGRLRDAGRSRERASRRFPSSCRCVAAPPCSLQPSALPRPCVRGLALAAALAVVALGARCSHQAHGVGRLLVRRLDAPPRRRARRLLRRRPASAPAPRSLAGVVTAAALPPPAPGPIRGRRRHRADPRADPARGHGRLLPHRRPVQHVRVLRADEREPRSRLAALDTAQPSAAAERAPLRHHQQHRRVLRAHRHRRCSTAAPVRSTSPQIGHALAAQAAPTSSSSSPCSAGRPGS